MYIYFKVIVSKNAEKEQFMEAVWEDAPASPNVGQRTDYRHNTQYDLVSVLLLHKGIFRLAILALWIF